MKYLISFGAIALLHLIPFLFLKDGSMINNIEMALLFPDIIILALVFTSEDKK